MIRRSFMTLSVLVLSLVLILFSSGCTGQKDIFEIMEHENALMGFYTRFGTTFNLTGKLLKMPEGTKEAVLVMKNNESEYILPTETGFHGNGLTFTTSPLINGGINLEGLPEGEYILFLKVTSSGEKSDVARYYPLSNDSGYGGFTYYTLSSPEGTKKIVFDSSSHEWEDGSSTYICTLSIVPEALPDNVYDIYIEVGHGGDDPGAVGWYNGEMYTEYSMNHTLAMKLKALLTERGYKVILSHETNTDHPAYNTGGRAVIPNDVKAKYSLSLHCNGANDPNIRGTEIYAPVNADYTFAKLLSERILESSGTVISNLGYDVPNFYQPVPGVWVRVMTQEETDQEAWEYFEKYGIKYYDNVKPMQTNWYYMIREPGGISTGAYVDGRYPAMGLNPYWQSNDTCEALIMEMDYMTNCDSLGLLLTNPDGYVTGAADAICEYIALIKADVPDKFTEE